MQCEYSVSNSTCLSVVSECVVSIMYQTAHVSCFRMRCEYSVSNSTCLSIVSECSVSILYQTADRFCPLSQNAL